MFCQKCGNKITEGANFCQKCGAALHIEQVEHNVEETAKYDVVLTDVGQKKISAIQVICRHGGLTLVEAKELVDNFDRLKVLKKSITETEAKAIQVAFAEIGARVILKYCKCCEWIYLRRFLSFVFAMVTLIIITMGRAANHGCASLAGSFSPIQ